MDAEYAIGPDRTPTGLVGASLGLVLTFGLNFGGTYDFSRDLSTVIYTPVGSGYADLYLLSQK